MLMVGRATLSKHDLLTKKTLYGSVLDYRFYHTAISPVNDNAPKPSLHMDKLIGRIDFRPLTI